MPLQSQSDLAADAPDAVSKGFVEAEGRLLHYVRRGRGPALVMLHASPCSAKVMAPLQRAWAEHFTSFAFDLPGFGLSDMPAERPVETRHLADAIAGAIRALGLGQVGLYGRHTGAGVAVEIVRRHPDLCSMALTDGYPVFSKPYTEERIAEYLPPITPRWDGGHLVWTWFRYREQHMFWPWDRPELAHRADTDLPDLDFLYRGAVEMLEAGDNYPEIYASAFRHEGLAAIGDLRAPVCFGARPGDSQFRTLPLYPASAWTRSFPRDHAEAAAQECAVLLTHPAAGDAPPWRSRFGASTQGALKDYVASRWGPLYVRAAGRDRPDLPVLALHDLPGAIDLEWDELAPIAQRHPLIGFDMTGCGHSVAAPGADLSPATWAEQAGAVLAELGVSRCLVLASGAAAPVALEFARRRPEMVAGIVFRAPPALAPALRASLADDYAPDITPQWDGGNFLRLWHHLRDQELWWPWNERTTAAARRTPPRITPAELHRRAVQLLKQPASYRPIWRAALAFPSLDRLAELDAPARLLAQEQDLFAFAAPAAGEALRSPPALLGAGACVADCALDLLAGLQ